MAAGSSPLAGGKPHTGERIRRVSDMQGQPDGARRRRTKSLLDILFPDPPAMPKNSVPTRVSPFIAGVCQRYRQHDRSDLFILFPWSFVIAMKPILLASHALTIVAPPVLAVSPVIRGMKPVGGRRGTDVVVTLTGQRLADTKDILFYQPGIRAGAKLLDEHNDELNVLNTIFGRVIDPQINDTPDPRVVSLAFKAAKRAVQLSGEKNPTHLDTLALG